MALPKQVQQQIEDVEELEKQMSAPSNDEKTDETPPPENVVELEQVAVQDKAVDDPNSETWHHRYKVLAGKYDAEVPRLHSQVKELGAKLTDALTQITEIRDGTTKPKEEATRFVSDKDVETFGQDLIDLQRRVAEEVGAKFESKLETLQAQNTALQAQLEKTGNRVSEMTFEQQLAVAVPDFDEINADPKWVAWLDEYDPLLRSERRVVAQKAVSAGDVDAIRDYVKIFRGIHQPAGVSKRQTELERQVAPSRTSASNGNATPQGKVYSNEQLENLFTKVRQMNIRGEHDAAATLEAELSAACVEGRVIR